MQVEVLFFGHLAEIAGTTKIRLQDVADSNKLEEIVHEMYPQMANLSYSIAVNKKTIEKNTPFEGDTHVAFLPPFSGG